MADVTQQIATLIAGMNLTDEQIALLTQNLATLKQNSLSELDDAVARAKEGTRLTRKGFELMGKAIAGKELHYTRVSIGDATVNGQMILPTEEEAYELMFKYGWYILEASSDTKINTLYKNLKTEIDSLN